MSVRKDLIKIVDDADPDMGAARDGLAEAAKVKQYRDYLVGLGISSVIGMWRSEKRDATVKEATDHGKIGKHDDETADEAISRTLASISGTKDPNRRLIQARKAIDELFNFPLYNGKLTLGEATRSQIAESAAAYAAKGKALTDRGAWLQRVADLIPVDGVPARKALSAKQAKELAGAMPEKDRRIEESAAA